MEGKTLLQKSFLPAVHFLQGMIFEPWTKGYLLALTYDAARHIIHTNDSKFQGRRDREGL